MSYTGADLQKVLNRQVGDIIVIFQQNTSLRQVLSRDCLESLTTCILTSQMQRNRKRNKAVKEQYIH